MISVVRVFSLFLGISLAPLAFAQQPTQGEDGYAARVLSAFFGLDNGLPFVANGLCLGAAAKTACREV